MIASIFPENRIFVNGKIPHSIGLSGKVTETRRW
jgi:hypothetical protein